MSFLSFTMKLKLKLLSSSSSSFASFDPNNSINNNIPSSKTATTPASGCLAAILRAILCSTTLPAHPSHQITHTQLASVLCEKDQQFNSQDRVMPSLLARLMGLEGVPNVTNTKISSTRSTNSLNFEASSGQMEGDYKHTRVKSSTLSILEVPTFFEVENDEFFVLSFGNGNEDEEKRSRRKKFGMGPGELKQRRGERCRNKHQGVSNKLENPCVGSEIMECEGAKLRRRKKKKKKVQSVEHESSSEDSSPVSVLDFDQFIMSGKFLLLFHFLSLLCKFQF